MSGRSPMLNFLRVAYESFHRGIIQTTRFLAVQGLLELWNDRVHHSAALQLLSHLLKLLPDEAAYACLAVDVSGHGRERFCEVLLQDCIDSFGAIRRKLV